MTVTAHISDSLCSQVEVFETFLRISSCIFLIFLEFDLLQLLSFTVAMYMSST